LPKLTKTYYLNFYGGEPLLCFPLIKKTLPFISDKNKELNKKVRYSITTNGNLLTGEIIQFLNEYKFSVELSFDGLAQNYQRKRGTFKKIVSNINKLLQYPDIDLENNSVFTAQTVGYISESIKFLIELGISDINLSLSIIEPWDQRSLMNLKNELTKLREILLPQYKSKQNIPVINFRENDSKGVFYCAAGKDRLAIAPDGQIWGCYLFPDYFKGKEESAEYQKFYFHHLDDFTKNYKNIYPKIFSNYTQLSMDNFSTSQMDCFLCKKSEKCGVCPINAAFSGVPLRKIPQYTCEIQKIIITEKEKFWKEFQKLEK